MQRTTIGMTKTPVVATKKNSMDDLVECLSSQYTVGRCLGEPGAFGSVYSIKDKKTGIKLAVKSLKIPAVDSQHYNTLMNLYRKEIDILGTLSHPGIVRLERVVRSRTHIYLVMERCAGSDLFDYINAKGGKISEKEAALVFRQILAPVAYLHDVAGVAHCDIKLANIMFTTAKSPIGIKLIDFGLSSRCQAGAILTSRSGTTAFMAPEQIKQMYGTQVDMWSLGVVLYIMLFGYSPWDPYCSYNNRSIENNILCGFRKETASGHGPWFPKTIPVSDLAKDIVSRLLCYRSSERITAFDAIQHPWFSFLNS